MNENLTSILITIVTLLFSGGAWKFYEFLVKNKREKNKDQEAEKSIYRDSLVNRVEKLESEKEKCLLSLLEISKEVSALRVRLEFIEKENEILKIKLQK
tara:strand:+ start:1312 stop:1608 length:297 start_codon:yes stop_codon:yes gene_type:complete